MMNPYEAAFRDQGLLAALANAVKSWLRLPPLTVDQCNSHGDLHSIGGDALMALRAVDGD
jgi:hypothetical protein